MKRLSFWDRLDGEEDLKKDSKFEQESLEFKKQGEAKEQAEFPKLNDEIWKAHEAFRWAKAVGEEIMLRDLDSKYQTLRHKKDSIRTDSTRRIEEKNQQRRELCRPFSEKAGKFIDDDLKEIMSRYVCELPPLRETLSGKTLDRRGFPKTIDSQITYMKIETNADAILRAQGLLTVYRGKVANAPSLKVLKEVLQDLDKQYSMIDFNPREVEVEEEGFRRLDAGNFKELGLYLGDKIFRKISGVDIFE